MALVGAADVNETDCDCWLTTWPTAEEVEAPKVADPAYVAVSCLVPADAKATTHVAVPEPSVWLPPVHETAVAPSRKTTVPVGVPDVAVTVAVSVTDCVTRDGLVDDVSAVVVAMVSWTVTGLLSALVAVHPARSATTL